MKTYTKEEFYSINKWYHATTADSARAIKKGVIATINKNKPLDFGYGFYLTPNKEWALNYLKGQLLISDSDNVIEDTDGYILEFDFLPNDFIEDYRERFFTGLDMKFVEFVYRNRMYYKYYFIMNLIYRYDMIAGPMSDGKQLDDFLDFTLGRITKGELFERLLVPKEDWQLTLHNQQLCDKLLLKKAYNVKGDEVSVESI